ncbi:MAG: hypothetical protein EP347_00920 [Alphaproteobacteria bacterium]|nr:MAG: hypothetical protein EP347_00920 [Alphaproteobacteria bacterium]
MSPMETLITPEIMSALGISVQIFLGILLADFISGFFHWLEDCYGREHWPVLGPYVIEPNIRHHSRPLDFTRGSYLFRNRVVLVLALLFTLWFWAMGWLNPFTLTALVFGSQANEIHCWAHMPTAKVPRWVQFLQRAGLFLTPFHHWRHHRAPFDCHYCTVTNFLNPVLDKIGFFRGLERMIWIVTSKSPRDRKITV